MDGIRIRCSVHNPCPICGATDWDMAIDYGEEGIVYWCHKATTSNNVIADGEEYVCIKADKMTSDGGRFNLYKKKSQYDACQERNRQKWIEEQRRNNPNWRDYPSKRNSAASKAQSHATEPVIAKKPLQEKTDVLPLSNRELDIRYRYFLSLLVLEKKHEKRLRAEWQSAVYPDMGEQLLRIYPIKSLPPEDFVRFRNTEKFENPTRKWIVGKMYEKFGDLRGIPGFFLRGGTWQDKPERERWSFAKGEGIIFPCYDVDGYIYRLRFREDYHGMKIKDDDPNRFEGMTGTFKHSYDKEGHHVWTFYPAGKKQPIIVYSQETKKVALNAHGLPVYGKAEGKYKTLSSYYAKQDGDYLINSMEGGCASGSPYSIYVPENASYRLCIATEGEKKGMVSAHIKGVPVITLPGVGTYGLLFQEENGKFSIIEKLKQKGLKMLIICYDADKADNFQVGGAEQRFVEACKKSGIIPLIGDWSGKFDKGLDDILLMGIDFQINKP